MADFFTLEELKRLEKLLQSALEEDKSELQTTSWHNKSSRPHLENRIATDQALLTKAKTLRQDTQLQLDHDGLLVQDFVVVAFRTVEGPRYSFVQSVKDSNEAKELCKKGFVAVVWPQITRKQSVARFIDLAFQEWLQTMYNATLVLR